MKHDRRALLINAGIELFSHSGFKKISVEEISSHCGLSVGTFYKHFASKEAFYETILEIITREGIRKARRVVDRLQSPVNQFRGLYQFVVLGVRRYPILRGVLANDQRFLFPGIEHSCTSVASMRAELQRMFNQIISEGARRGIFRPGLYSDASVMVVALIELVIINQEREQSEELAQDLLTLLQRGLRRAVRIPRPDELRDRRTLERYESEDPLPWLES